MTWLQTTLIVDCDDEQAAIASLECHKKYLAALEDHPPAKDFIPLILRGESLKESPRVKFKVYEL